MNCEVRELTCIYLQRSIILDLVLNPSEVRDVFSVYRPRSGSADNFHEKSFGRWIVRAPLSDLDKTWQSIIQEMEEDRLSTTGLKSSTGRYNPSSTGPGPVTLGVVSVYTTEENMDKVGYELIALVKHDIVYKPNSASGKYRHKGDRKFVNTLYWKKGHPSYKSSRTYQAKWSQTGAVRDVWHLNIAESSEPFELKGNEKFGFWRAESKIENLTALWHAMKEKVESGELGPVKMECPAKQVGGRDTHPVVLLYTKEENRADVGSALGGTKLVKSQHYIMASLRMLDEETETQGKLLGVCHCCMCHCCMCRPIW